MVGRSYITVVKCVHLLFHDVSCMDFIGIAVNVLPPRCNNAERFQPTMSQSLNLDDGGVAPCGRLCGRGLRAQVDGPTTRYAEFGSAGRLHCSICVGDPCKQARPVAFPGSEVVGARQSMLKMFHLSMHATRLCLPLPHMSLDGVCCRSVCVCTSQALARSRLHCDTSSRAFYLGALIVLLGYVCVCGVEACARACGGASLCRLVAPQRPHGQAVENWRASRR